MDSPPVNALRLKLAYLNNVLALLKERVALPFDEYSENLDRQLAVERLCQIAADASTDTCQMCLELGDEIAPATARATIEAARQKGIISGEVWGSLDDYLRVRNEIVHEYDSIVSRSVYDEAKQLIATLPGFLAEVETHLQSKSGEA